MIDPTMFENRGLMPEEDAQERPTKDLVRGIAIAIVSAVFILIFPKRALRRLLRNKQQSR
ncbi:MAG TPA: hypothetical protein VFT64_07120 [Rickettsiales bacterium]|nr:hypothetical protein [Rickettsiales bacterium]